MALSIIETFGYQTTDGSSVAVEQRASLLCPFVGKPCWKKFRSSGLIHGTCVVKPPTSAEVIVCPDRLYAENFKILRDVARDAFQRDVTLIGPDEVAGTIGTESRVVVFGKRWGKELRVPKGNHDASGYSADWVLALITADNALQEFVPVEVQSMDTTGSYQREWYNLNGLELPADCDPTSPHINWENVNKRIIPQLLTKGNVFGREALCNRGLFFVCPTPVFNKLIARLGAVLSPYPMRSGTITFKCYGLGAAEPGSIRPLVAEESLTTTVENLKEAFNSILNLPAMGVMSETIRNAIASRASRSKKAKGSGSNL